MTDVRIKNFFLGIIALYVFFMVSFYFIAGDQLKYKPSVNNILMPEADSVTDEIVSGVTVSQSFINSTDRIESFEIVFTKFYREGSGKITIELLDGDSVLNSKTMRLKEVPEQHRVYLDFDEPIENVQGKELTIRITANSSKGYGAAVMMRKEGVSSDSVVTMGKKTLNGTLCFAVSGSDLIYASQFYWYIAFGGGLLILFYLFITYKKYLRGQYSYLINAILAIYQYSFLISQLVSRDFKSKYKRSILGVFWSFLNPLMTMTVQFLVFSTLFKGDTQNYPVYLLSGVICFNFFKETTDMCLTSISGNANLINKVYIPKYIFPLARTISSSINLGISLVPLLLVSFLMGVGLHVQSLLIFYFLFCLIIFSLGMGMFLATLMVFFRDIQFLWSVISQIWLYATPIFYPAEIIPDKFKFIVRLNPLYHFIGNLRKCLIDGISPEPFSYIYCLLFATASFFIGTYLFKKAQDRFTLYL